MRFLFFVIGLFLFTSVHSQQDESLRIIVIPFNKEGQEMRQVYEADSLSHVRVAIAKVKSAFDTAQIKTIDLHPILKNIANDRIIVHNQQTSLKGQILQQAAADIYIEVEAKIVKTNRGNSVTVILNAYDAFSGQSISNGLGHSPKFYTENYERLSEKALDKFLKNFLQNTKIAFDDLSKNGRSITLNIGLAEETDMDLDTEVGKEGDLLSDVIEKWLEENALKSQFNIQGITATQMIVNEVKIPKLDKANNKNYSPSKFAKAFYKHLKSLGIDSVRDVQGTNIFITIE